MEQLRQNEIDQVSGGSTDTWMIGIGAVGAVGTVIFLAGAALSGIGLFLTRSVARDDYFRISHGLSDVNPRAVQREITCLVGGLVLASLCGAVTACSGFKVFMSEEESVL
jgi:hypothetical protein